jgi:hypothetical protein
MKKCFDVYFENKIKCDKKNCKEWIKNSESYNCAIVASNIKNYTLNEVGEIYGLTRMRICQIEKKICNKIKNDISSEI